MFWGGLAVVRVRDDKGGRMGGVVEVVVGSHSFYVLILIGN